MNINMYIEEKCNLNCSYCYVNKKNTKDAFLGERFINFCEQLKSENINNISFTGGEPLLNPFLEQYLEIVRKFYFTAHLLTNGTIKMNSDLLKYFSSIIFSIDGDLNEMINNRGIDNLCIIEENIRKVLKHGKRIKITCVVTKKTVNSFAQSLLNFILRNNLQDVLKEIRVNAVDSDDSNLCLNQNHYLTLLKGIRVICNSNANYKVTTNILDKGSLRWLRKKRLDLPLWYNLSNGFFYFDRGRKFEYLKEAICDYETAKLICLERLDNLSKTDRYFLFSKGVDL